MNDGVPDTSENATSFEVLEAEIAAAYGSLSPRLRQIASFALANPTELALETVATIAARAGVQPSALIRFSKAFGFDGFSEMQRVFRTRLASRAPSYQERLRQGGLEGARKAAAIDSIPDILTHFVDAGLHALDHLRDTVDADRFSQAAERLAASEIIHVCGHRRSYPVAAYLSYAFGHLGLRVHHIDGLGGMGRIQASGMRPSDTLIAVSFAPYAPETLDIVRHAQEVGAGIVAVTDTALSPIAQDASETFLVEDAEVQTFRSLTATMCLAISLVVAVGHILTHRQAAPAETPRSP